ncbi:hypothetical protein ANDA3_3902 [plant metagenome]|uniref:Uncharacterized protein n=1 Tax=plant metagenome TaxID=1297885 RepID=A0A484T4A1_9ZZZZ
MGLLNGVVSGIAQGWATRQIVQDCLEDSQWAAAKSFWTLMGQSIHRGNSSIRVEAAGDARVEVALTTPYPKRSLEYAFYLRGPSGELLQTPYQKSPKASFELAEMPLPALVTVFAKDGLGIIKTIRQRVVAL